MARAKMSLAPQCPYCKQNNTIKYGTHKRKHQRYWCKDCKRKYTRRTKVWQEARNLVVLCRKKRDPFVIIQRIVRDAFPTYSMPDSTLSSWLQPLHTIVKHRGKNSPSFFSANILKETKDAKQIEYEHEYALAGNTGIYIIDELTKDIKILDFRSEVRQQTALECLLIGLDRLDGEQIKGIIKKAKKEYLRTMGKYRDISLYSKLYNSERNLIDIIVDPSAIDPIELIS